MNCLGNPSLDNMGHSDGWIGDGFLREDLLSSIEDSPDEALMRDRHLIVFGEHRNDAVIGDVTHLDLLGVRLNEREIVDRLLLGDDLIGGNRIHLGPADDGHVHRSGYIRLMDSFHCE